MLPVSQYEALLAEVRGLRRKAQRVQELATPLISSSSSSALSTPSTSHKNVEYPTVRNNGQYSRLDYNMERHYVDTRRNSSSLTDYEVNSSAEGETTCSEEEYVVSRSSNSVNSEPTAHYSSPLLYHNSTWTAERTMWNSEPAKSESPDLLQVARHLDTTSVMSFACSSGGAPLDRVLGSPNLSRRSSSNNQLEAKVDMVYSLLAMLGGQEHADMGETLLALSTNPESCVAMRQSGCIPLLVQLVQSDKDCETRTKAAHALQNLINAQPDEKIRKREVRIFKLLEQIREYTEALRTNGECQPEAASEDGDIHPVQTVAHLMKLSFDEGHRYAICQLGGINIIATLIEMEHAKHGSINNEFHCVLLRRYACMSLTNLTFGDSGNKALLCSCREFMRALVVQLQSPSDELRQVTASVLRNLSWRADSTSKEILREVGTVTGLMKAAMINSKENTLKSILSALWNLSAHSTENKAEICAIDGALGFLVDMLTYKTPSKTLTIIENAGGILRNISSQIAVRDDYREILREHNCLEILLEQLKSPSLTVVSNACGTLWNLSAKNTADQDALWEMGAPGMLRSLNHSKHKMIAMGSSAALKNLLSSRPKHNLTVPLDATARAMDLPVLPTLGARKQKAILADLDQNLSETFENIDRDSPNLDERRVWKADCEQNCVAHAEDARGSVRSDSFLSEASSSGEGRSFRRRRQQKEETFSESVCSKSSSGYLTSTPVVSDFDGGSKLSRGSFSLNVSGEQGVPIDNEMFKVRQKSQSDEKDHCSIEDASDSDEKPKSADICERLSEPREDYNFDKGRLSNCNGLPLGADASFVALDDITAHLEDLDSLDMGNVQGRDSGRFVRSKRKSKRRSEEKADCQVEDVEKVDEVTSEEIRQTLSIPESLNETYVVNRASEKFVAYTTQRKTEIAVPSPVSSIPPVLVEETQKPNVLPSTLPVNDPPPQLQHEETKIPVQTTQEDQKPPPATEETHLEISADAVETSIDNRMLDPDAMIESLDRFTAELVSQASHLQNKDDTKYNNTSVTEGSTWNEDTSPNDVTFPSISGSAPNVITFESDCGNKTISDEVVEDVVLVENEEKGVSNDFSSLNTTSTMTDSTLIAMEATKIMNAMRIEDVAPKKGPTTNLVKLALSNSFNQTCSSLENLDYVNPPSTMGELLDMDGSMTSVASLASEIAEATKSEPNAIFALKQPHLVHMNSVSEIETINPPSLLNEVTDVFNSLNDVNTEIINGDDATEAFEDCCTHITDATLQDCSMNATLQDCSNNATPLPSDYSSAESTPKRSKPLNKHLTPKQRRNLAKERYKTYTVAAEMVTQQRSLEDSSELDYKTCASDVNSDESASVLAGKLTPRERRRQDRSRFETQVIDASVNDLQQLEDASSSKGKRRNSDRFKTRTLNDNELQNLVQEEANLVLKSLKETKSVVDDLLECETLSLVSNEDDSENNSGGSVNYRTYHKSWNLRPNVPIIHPLATDPLNCAQSNLSDDQDEVKVQAKPKIVKPSEKPVEVEEKPQEEPKGIRGRRKPLYTRAAPKTVNTNLVKNVTSTIRPAVTRTKTAKPVVTATLPAAKTRLPSTKTVKSPAKVASAPAQPAQLERQGTFTKDTQPPKSRIPKPPSQSKIARPVKATTTTAATRPTSVGKPTGSSPSRTYNRSASADGKKAVPSTSVPKASSSTSVSGADASKKQITSKIASLWKRIEQTKKQPAKQDGRVWISPNAV